MVYFKILIILQFISGSVIHGVAKTEFLDKPIQLVAPDPLHKGLVLLEDNVKLLHGIDSPVATVAVVGKFHSGKSFLMNQLMGKSSGFGVGPSVRPKTMGLWMWGKPVKMSLASGKKASVIFLDTEGFAANNISENYDAKIFAVATLISSHLIYNSVKIIDQADIDYLELLARRTQLFALRSQMSRAKWMEDFNQELLNFPPLIWVVQDFVQSTEDGESTKQWLHRLMGTHTRENEDYDISLLSIFPSVDCHTLFLPAVKKHLLMDLSMATEDDLTEEYKLEREELMMKLRQNIVPKEKNHKPLTGRELAALLEILVSAANDGSLANIPSRWNVFVERLKNSATEDCMQFYESEMATLDSKNNGGPIRVTELKIWHNHSYKKAVELLLHLLHGLEDAVSDSEKKLKQKMALFHERAIDMNEKKIRLRCSELLNKYQLKAEENLGAIQLPIPTIEMFRKIDEVSHAVQTGFLTELDNLLEAQQQLKQVQALNNSVSTLGQAYQMRNLKAIEDVLQRATKAGANKFKELIQGSEDGPRKPKILDMVYGDGLREAKLVFSKECSIYKTETVYPAFKALFEGEVNKQMVEMNSENEKLFKTLAHQTVLELLTVFSTKTDSQHLPLPQNKSELDLRLQLEGKTVLKGYKENLEDFNKYPAYDHNYKELLNELEKMSNVRRQENVEAFTRVVEKPLKTAKQIILLSSDNYKTEFSLRQYMVRVCLLQLEEGQAKFWSSDLKTSIIDHFVQSEDSLQSALRSKQGYWSSFIGFVQWVLWYLHLY